MYVDETRQQLKKKMINHACTETECLSVNVLYMYIAPPVISWVFSEWQIHFSFKIHSALHMHSTYILRHFRKTMQRHIYKSNPNLARQCPFKEKLLTRVGLNP